MEFDTWLKEEDIQRLWDVVHGTLPEIAASSDEIDEFQRLVTHCAMLKVGGVESLNPLRH
jgi:hypothetical protein